MMQQNHLQSWVRSVIQDVLAGEIPERVTLWADWPQPQNVARRLAGEANRVNGETILWLIGFDQESGATDVVTDRAANWYARLAAEFDGHPPALKELLIRVNGKTAIALCFETLATPFVIKQDNQRLEVPWHDGMQLRSATQTDLLGLLKPLRKLPLVQLLGGVMLAEKIYEDKPELLWILNLALYVEPRSNENVDISFHKCQATFEMLPAIDQTNFELLLMSPYQNNTRNTNPSTLSRTIHATEQEVVITGVGTLYLEANAITPAPEIGFLRDALVTITLLPTGATQPLKLRCALSPRPVEDGQPYEWTLLHDI